MPSYLGSGPDETDAPGNFNPKLQSVLNYANRTGRTALANRYTRKLTNHGFDIDPSAGMDFNSADLSGAGAVMHTINQGRKAAGRPTVRPDVSRARIEALGDENYYNNTFDPALDQAESSVSDLLSKPTFSPDYVSQARSQIANIVKGGAERNLRGISASLGLRGMDASSPAAMAVAARAAQEADTELASTLGSFGLQIEDLERGDQASEANLLTQIAGARMAGRNNSRESAKELTALLGALRTQHDAEEAARAAIRGQGRDWLGFAANGIQTFAKEYAGMPPDASAAGAQPSPYSGGTFQPGQVNPVAHMPWSVG